MDSGVDAMDDTPDLLPTSLITSPHVFRLPPLPTVLPPPPPFLGNSVPLCSPPGLVSPRVPPQVPTEKVIYTLPQLVATHILRIHERGVKTPSSHPRTLRARSPLSKSLGPRPTYSHIYIYLLHSLTAFCHMTHSLIHCIASDASYACPCRWRHRLRNYI